MPAARQRRLAGVVGSAPRRRARPSRRAAGARRAAPGRTRRRSRARRATPCAAPIIVRTSAVGAQPRSRLLGQPGAQVRREVDDDAHGARRPGARLATHPSVVSVNVSFELRGARALDDPRDRREDAARLRVARPRERVDRVRVRDGRLGAAPSGAERAPSSRPCPASASPRRGPAARPGPSRHVVATPRLGQVVALHLAHDGVALVGLHLGASSRRRSPGRAARGPASERRCGRAAGTRRSSRRSATRSSDAQVASRSRYVCIARGEVLDVRLGLLAAAPDRGRRAPRARASAAEPREPGLRWPRSVDARPGRRRRRGRRSTRRSASSRKQIRSCDVALGHRRLRARARGRRAASAGRCSRGTRRAGRRTSGPSPAYWVVTRP